MLLPDDTIKKHIAIFFITNLICSGAFSFSGIPISYSSAIQLALNHNPQLQGNQASIEAAKGALKQADSMHWPELDLEVTGATSDNPMSVFGYKLSQGNASFADFGANQYTGGNTLYKKPNALNHPGYYSNLDTAFKLIAPIYSGGKIQAQQSQKRALLQSAHHGNERAKNQLAYELYAAYEGFLTARQLVAVANNQVAQARDFLEKTRALKKQSITLDSDLLMAEHYLTHSSLGLSSAKMQADNELDSFRTLLGNPNDAHIPKQHMSLIKTMNNTNTLIRQTMSYNPAIKELSTRLEAEKASVGASKAAYKPQVNLQLKHEWNGNSLGSGLPSDTVAIGANWTLFSAGERDGALESALANSKKVQFELDELRNQLGRELKQILRNDVRLHYELELNQNMADKEEIIIRKLSQRFERGLTPLSALLESQMKLTQSKAQVLQTLHQLRLNQAHLLLLTNRLIPKAMKSV